MSLQTNEDKENVTIVFFVTVQNNFFQTYFMIKLYSKVGSFQRAFRVTLHEVLQVTIFYLCSSLLCQILGRTQLLVYFGNRKSMISTTVIFMKSILNNFIRLRKSQRRVAPAHSKPLEGKFRCKYYEPISQQPGGTSIGLTR